MKPSKPENADISMDALAVGESDEAKFTRVIRYFLENAPRRGEKTGRKTSPSTDPPEPGRS